MNGWIGVDLDGTLAIASDTWFDDTVIGEPVPAMVARIKAWRLQGIEVRILTARVYSGNPRRVEVMRAIQAWCLQHIGEALPVTSEKDYEMLALWDDRVVRVEKNTGKVLSEKGESDD